MCCLYVYPLHEKGFSASYTHQDPPTCYSAAHLVYNWHRTPLGVILIGCLHMYNYPSTRYPAAQLVQNAAGYGTDIGMVLTMGMVLAIGMVRTVGMVLTMGMVLRSATGVDISEHCDRVAAPTNKPVAPQAPGTLSLSRNQTHFDVSLVQSVRRIQ